MNNSGFNAMGKPIPVNRKHNAVNWLESIGIYKRIDDICLALELDQPDQAFRLASQMLDVTGCYRLLSLLLTD